MISAYFWKGGEVVEFHPLTSAENVRLIGFYDCYCLDVSCNTLESRYGMFKTSKAWVHTPPSNFPKDFLTILMLQGVPLG